MAAARTLFPAFTDAARRHAGWAALSDGGRTLTYAQVAEHARCVGRALIALGVQKGDKVAIWAVNHADWVIAGLGIQAAGAVLVLIGTRLRGGEAADILRRSGCVAVFMDATVAGYDLPAALASQDLPLLRQQIVFGSGGASAPLFDWAGFMREGDKVGEVVLASRTQSVTADDLADLIFTSGTTGKPKGVGMTHAQSLVACEQQQLCTSRFEAGEASAVFYPFAHNAGYRAGWQASLLYGARVIPVRDYDPAAILDLIERERVAVMPIVPTLAQALIDHPSLPYRDLSSLRYVATGAATIPVDLIANMRAKLGARQVATGYGLTEAAGSVSNTRSGDDDEVVALTTGLPLDNLEVRILDGEQREVPTGEPGEIAVRGFQVTHGYYEDAEATAKAFTGGFLLTGDVGLFTPAGHLKITDRIKDMYLCGGFNCYPAEIEAILRGADAVASVAVVGVPDARLGEVGRAFVVRANGTAADEASLIDWARPRMANYKIPRSIVFIDALPLNATGKVDKIALRNFG